ncbi:MAG TPA: hypothetical protein VFT22_23545 [Kofleriaceae bacterium]|nr:hypothetical protein [Kofleriaceae bacterium]
MRSAIALLALVVTGCTDDTDPPWQLDHDRIIAVRATPPRIAAGEQAVIDALIGHKGAPVAEQSPDEAIAVSPASLSGALGRDASRWMVTAPDGPGLAAARGELGLPGDAPVRSRSAWRTPAARCSPPRRCGSARRRPTRR